MVSSTWITVVILELIHAKNPDSRGRDVFIRYGQPGQQCPDLVNHNNSSNRIALRWRWVIQISALSAFDGSVVDYHGIYG